MRLSPAVQIALPDQLVSPVCEPAHHEWENARREEDHLSPALSCGGLSLMPPLVHCEEALVRAGACHSIGVDPDLLVVRFPPARIGELGRVQP